MKAAFLIFTGFIILAACSDNMSSGDEISENSIIGAWNVIKYIDIEGNELQTTYIIFLWYEEGLEFINETEFYPRQINLEHSEWATDYNNGPGSYQIIADSLVLSYEDYSLKYGIEKMSNDSLIISNYSNNNPWKGIWFMVKEQK